MIRRLAGSIAIMAVAVATAQAQPQPSAPSDDTLRAVELFDLGLEHKRAGDLDAACAAFAESERLESAVGTQLNLAACLERDGKLADAMAMLRAAADAADARGDTVRAQRARDDLAALEDRIAAAAAQPPQPQQPSVPEPVPLPPLGDRGARRPGRFTSVRKVAVGVGALGIAGIVIGSVRGVQARGYQADSDAICPTTTCTSPAAVDLNRQARSAGTQATVSLAVGAAAIAGGVALWIVGRPEDGVSIVAGDGTHVGVVLAGGF